MDTSLSTAFVTGATGLLGNNLVRQLLERGFRVKALVRSKEKAERQFARLPVEIVTGDMGNVAGFAQDLRGADVLFHTAGYFRDGFKSGRHYEEFQRINVLGTRDLLSHAYSAGIRRIVHTSSTSVLRGLAGELIDETMSRSPNEATDYPLSKILADVQVMAFLKQHSDASACMVLPGWMIGPGDIGPTGSGELVLNFMRRQLPGVPPASFSAADARDVAEAHIEAPLKGRRGERYIAAGQAIEMSEIFALLEKVTGVPAPKRSASLPLLYALASANEAWHFLSKRPALISWASVRLMATQRYRNRFDSSKAERELGVRFRPLEDTLRDTVAWYRQNGWISGTALENKRLGSAGQPI